MEEGGFVAYLEGVEGVFDWAMEFCFVVVEGDDVRRFFGRWVVVFIFGGLVLGDGYEVCFNGCMYGGEEGNYIDGVNDVQRVTRVAI